MHKDQMASLFERGRIVISGPFTDGSPVDLLILDADEPDHIAGLLGPRPVLGAWTDRRPTDPRWSPFFGAARPEA